MKFTICICLLCLLCSVSARNTIFQYSASTQTTEAYALTDSTGLLATSAGVARYIHDSVVLERSPRMKDVRISAMTRDDSGTVWLGSAGGYVYRTDERLHEVTPYGDLTILGESRVRQFLFYESLMLVAHDNGLSLFDREQESFIRTATEFGQDVDGDPIAGAVSQLFIVDDTLFALSGNSLVYYENLSERVRSLAFSDPSQWEYRELTPPLELGQRLFFAPDETFLRFRAPARFFGDHFFSLSELSLFSFSPQGDTIEEYSFHTEAEEHRFDSLITLSPGVDSLLFLGTNRGQFLMFNTLSGETEHVLSVPGLRKNDICRVFLARDGALWMLPYLAQYREEWGHPATPNQIVRMAGDSLTYYGPHTEGIGLLGRSDTLSAITEDTSGILYVGSPSEHVIRYRNGAWERVLFDANYEEPPVVTTDNSHPRARDWMKIDRMHVDQKNTLWGVNWRGPNSPSQTPYAWAWNEERDSFRTFGVAPDFANRTSAYYLAPGADTTMAVFFNNSRGSFTVLDGRLSVFDESRPYDDIRRDSSTVGARVFDVASLASGSIVAATQDGIGSIRYTEEETVQEFLRIDEGAATAVAVGRTMHEEGRSVTDIWVGVREQGIFLFGLYEYVTPDGEFDRFELRREESFSPITSREGLGASTVEDMVFDGEGNRLWVATLNGVNRVEIYRDTRPLDEHSSETLRMYPNPFIRSDHKEVTIAGVSRNSYVDIYTESGRLTARLTPYNSALSDTTPEGIIQYRWRPSSSLPAGVYMVVVKDGRDDNTKVAVSKLLILP
ncbi:T9SS type A sorting domain-containing protein [Chitinivibrio alkaliphilus]|uniref:Uncharacterized protein n=1 Tax=Chitinivibrio alkaliphilus ACht1 TaxID=1313304 RepID=U7DAG5_9BACT|nr:T9SS type A sorting domain-containing protein [Chitinivibrio alkaliphilus]ERP39022.1 hypothetical protein CALK_0515 [Chitinivibrio alkaliphilus ACht1]